MIRPLLLGLAALCLAPITAAQPVAIVGEKVWTGTARTPNLPAKPMF